MIFNIAMEKFWIFVWKSPINILKWMLSVVLRKIYVTFAYLLFIKHNPPKNLKYIV